MGLPWGDHGDHGNRCTTVTKPQKKIILRDEKRCNHEVNSTFVFLHLQQLSLVDETATGTSLHPPLSLTVIEFISSII